MENQKAWNTNDSLELHNQISSILSFFNLKLYSFENIKYKATSKARAVYKVETNQGTKCLKKVFYDKPTLLFIYSVIEWLNLNNIDCPRFIHNRYHIPYFTYQDDLYILTEWIEGRKCDYDKIEDIKKAAKNLAKIHKASKNFFPISLSKININEATYCDSFDKHFTGLLETSNKAFIIKDRFSKLYLDCFDYYHEAARESLNILSSVNSSLPLGDSVSNCAICHLDYVNKNLIFDQQAQIHVIDFDNTRIDYPVHDISKFFIRILKRQSTNWDFNLFIIALEEYETIRPLSYNEHLVLLSLFMFPSKLWKITRDYYKNRTLCNKEAFISLLKKIIAQKDSHYNFCINYQDYINIKKRSR